MKTLIKACIYLLNAGLIVTAQAGLLETNTHNNIIYFADDASTVLKRYSLSDEKFLAPITLTQTPSALHVDNTGIYIGYNTTVVKLTLAGTNATQIAATAKKVLDIETTDQYLLVGGIDFVQSLNKANYAFISELRNWNSELDMSLSPDNRQVFYTSNQVSPEDIYQTPLLDNGTFGPTKESPYHGDYVIGNHPIVMPNKTQVITTAGNIYHTMDLTFAGNLGGAYNDIDFWQGLPIVLRGNKLYSYNQAGIQTGIFSLPPGVNADKMAIYSNKVFVFSFDATGGNHANSFNITLLSPADPAAAINPSDIPYTPDSLALDSKQDTAFLLSRDQLSIFRWSISQAIYLESIPLLNAPLYMSYSAEHGRIYLAYSNGDISYINLADNKEYPFSSIAGYPSAIISAGQYLIAKGSQTSWWEGLTVYNKQGIHIDSRAWIEPTSQLAWDSVYGELYYIGSFSLKRIAMDAVSGLFGTAIENPFYTSDWRGPIRISETGKFIGLGNGRVVDRRTLTEQADVEPIDTVKDLAWLHGNLFTIKGVEANTYTQLRRWSADFTQNNEATYEVKGSPIGLLPIVNSGKLLLIYSKTGKPQFELLSYTAADFDKDGYLDSQDAFPTDKTEWVDLDGDDIGDNSDADIDGDGTPNTQDAFLRDSKETLDTDRDGIGNNADTDDDNDGVLDIKDAFPLNAKESTDMDNDGFGDNSDTDIDGDGILNSNDAFPLNPLEWLDTDKDGLGNNADTDDDNDGVLDDKDALPLNAKESTDIDNDGIGDNSDSDIDGDGILNSSDAFPVNPLEWLDTDKDGTGDNADTDDDNDGILDTQDAFPRDATEATDMDYDGIGDNKDTDRDDDSVPNRDDAFPSNYFEWADADKDGEGDNSDLDDDNDGVPDYQDAFSLNATESADKDHDGTGDNTDPDIDGDYIPNISDAFPLDYREWLDTDHDGNGDNADKDDDNDGVVDYNDFYPQDAAKSEINASNFLPLIAGSSWLYDTSSKPATLGKAITIAGESVTPIQLPAGGKLYLKIVDNQIQLFGFYLPELATDYGDYNIDVTLKQGMSLLHSNDYARGAGNVNISPKYGNRSLNWVANVESPGMETISVPAQSYTALHTRLYFLGSTVIDGETITFEYDLDLWLAENVGIVKIEENGNPSELVSSSFEQSTSGDNPSPPAIGKSGGGKSNWLFFAILLLCLGYRRQQNINVTQ